MTELKLAKLPDKMPVKLTVSLTPDLKSALDDYLSIYRTTYQDESVGVGTLCPRCSQGKQVGAKMQRLSAASEDAPPPASPYFSNQEAAAFLRLSPRTLEEYRVIGGGPPFRKFGRRVFYTRGDLETWARSESAVPRRTRHGAAAKTPKARSDEQSRWKWRRRSPIGAARRSSAVCVPGRHAGVAEW